MNRTVLPPDYRQVYRLDLKNDRTLGRLLNIVGTLIFLAVLAIGYFVKPFPFGASLGLVQVAGLVAALLAYVILHELTHAAFMRLFVKSRVRFGFNAYAAYAGMDEGYFGKGAYVLIALAPFVLYSAILIPLTLIIAFGPATLAPWYWPTLIILGLNAGGSIGDFYVVGVLMKHKEPILIHDDGLKMEFYQPDQS